MTFQPKSQAWKDEARRLRGAPHFMSNKSIAIQIGGTESQVRWSFERTMTEKERHDVAERRANREPEWIEKAKALKDQGLGANKIATECGVCPTTVKYWTNPAIRERALVHGRGEYRRPSCEPKKTAGRPIAGVPDERLMNDAAMFARGEIDRVEFVRRLWMRR